MPEPSLLRGTLLLTLSNLIIRIVSMLFQIYLSAAIGAEGLGLMQLAASVGTLALTLGSSGIRIAAMYLTAEEHGKRRPAGVRSAMNCCMRTGFCLSLLAGLLLVCFAPRLAAGWISDPRAAISLRIIGIFLPFTCLNCILTGYFTACGKLGKLVAIELIERLLSVLLTIVLLRRWAGNDLARACCVIFGCSSFPCACSFFVMYAIYRRDCRVLSPALPQPRMGRRLARLCIPLAVNEYLRSGLSTLEHLLIPYGLRRSGVSASHSMAAYGTIHGMVFPVITFASVLLYSLSDVLVPELARCCASGNAARIRHLTDKCLRFGLVFSAAVSGLLFCLARPLSQLLYRSGTAGVYIRFFAPLVLILYLDAIVDGMHKGLGQQLSCMRYNTLTSFLDVLLIFLLLPKYGLGGYLFSFTVTHLLNFYLSIRRLLVVTGYPLPASFFLQTMLFALLSVLLFAPLAAHAQGMSAILFLSGAFLCLFLLLLTCTGAFSFRDLRWLSVLLRPRHRLRKTR